MDEYFNPIILPELNNISITEEEQDSGIIADHIDYAEIIEEQEPVYKPFYIYSYPSNDFTKTIGEEEPLFNAFFLDRATNSLYTWNGSEYEGIKLVSGTIIDASDTSLNPEGGES